MSVAEPTRSPGELDAGVSQGANRRRWTGFAAGIVLAIVIYVIMPGSVSHSAKMTAATVHS